LVIIGFMAKPEEEEEPPDMFVDWIYPRWL
jgi:hypothetical protein